MHIIADTLMLAAVIPLLLHMIWLVLLLAIVLVCDSLSNIAELNFVTHETFSHAFFSPVGIYRMPSPRTQLMHEPECVCGFEER